MLWGILEKNVNTIFIERQIDFDNSIHKTLQNYARICKIKVIHIEKNYEQA